jgi:hypothetical protein
MPTLMVRYQTAEDGVDDVVEAVEKAFAAINEQRPDGIRFSYWHRAGSTEFLALLELDDDVQNPLLTIDAAEELRSVIAKWVIGDPPAPQPLTLLGSYR